MTSARNIAFLIVWAVLGLLIGYFWSALNINTDTTGWSIAVVLTWYYDLLLILSAGITAGIFKKLKI